MLYVLNKDIFLNETVFQENRLAKRGYFVPFSCKEKAEGVELFQ